MKVLPADARYSWSSDHNEHNAICNGTTQNDEHDKHKQQRTTPHVCVKQLTDFLYSAVDKLDYCKGKGLDTCYSATWMSQTRDQQRFTISEVAADSHEPMVPQRIVWLPIARANGQSIGPTVQLADTPSPQSATLCIHPVAVVILLISRLAKVGG